MQLQKISLRYLLLVFGFLFLKIGFAQVLEGTIVDAKTGEPIPYAQVYCLELHNGTTSDEDGFWKLEQVLSGKFSLQFSAVGYESRLINVEKTESSLQIKLEGAHINLDEVIVSTSVSNLQRFNTSPVDARKLSELNNIQQSTLIEALSNIPGVYNLSTGNGISKPVIRGLSGMRVLTVQNGLRIENQQWGGDHGFALNELGVNKVEVIKGPSSLIYGADALGGVIYVEDEPYANANENVIEASTKFESNSMASINSLSYKTSKNHLRFSVHGGYFNRADYRIPGNKFVANSRNSGSSLKAAVGYHKNNWITNLRYQFLNSVIGLPGHTHDSVFVTEDFLTNNQRRSYTIPSQNITNHLALWENKFYFNKSNVVAQVGFTSNRLQEFEEKITIPGIDMTLTNYTYSLRWNYQINDYFELVAGTQGMIQQSQNAPAALDILITNSSFSDAGAYSLIVGSYKLWNFKAGARYDQRTVATLKGLDFQKQFEGLNYALGVARSSRNFTGRLNVSSGFRPPHISEILANGVHHGSTRFLIGDLNLAAERATQIDLYLAAHGEHLEIIVNPFVNIINNFIYQDPSNQFINGYQVFNFQQTNAVLSGGDIAFHYHPHLAHWLHLESNFSMLQTQDEFGNPLPQIPQNRINNTVKVDLNSKNNFKINTLSLQYAYYFNQNNVSAFETPTQAFSLLNLGVVGSFDKTQKLEFSFGINNLLNESYIDHLSRLKPYLINNPGRNFYLKLNYLISKTKVKV